MKYKTLQHTTLEDATNKQRAFCLFLGFNLDTIHYKTVAGFHMYSRKNAQGTILIVTQNGHSMVPILFYFLFRGKVVFSVTLKSASNEMTSNY